MGEIGALVTHYAGVSAVILQIAPLGSGIRGLITIICASVVVAWLSACTFPISTVPATKTFGALTHTADKYQRYGCLPSPNDGTLYVPLVNGPDMEAAILPL